MYNDSNEDKFYYDLLSKIKHPKDLNKLKNFELTKLCKEIRNKIIFTVSKNGGHLASSLGVVELTVALHKEFNSPKDKIVWDTGHQSYAHKLLTGRFENFNSLRKKGGVGALINPEENEHDIFIAGHCSNSISAACGLARAEKLKGTKNTIIVVIGDGALTGGMAYEGLNNASDLNNLIIIFNCNDMSISKTVGGFSKYISNFRVNKTYISINILLKKILKKVPFLGKITENLIYSIKEKIKKIIYKTNFFTELGFSYLNFVDGHNISKIENALKWAKSVKKSAIIQVFTKKGKGFLKAEENPELYHSVSSFNINEGIFENEKELNFSTVFGKEILNLAEKDDNICAITAAMGASLKLKDFEKKFKERYYDVGIAEEHAVTFSAGLFKGGMLPVFAIYSTFLQRSYDQLIHDVAIQNSHIVLAIDRAGMVEDGKTHQGVFDVSFLTSIPNTKIFVPATYEELKIFLKKALYEEEGIVAVRFPKGEQMNVNFSKGDYSKNKDYLVYGESKIVIITYGIIFKEAFKAKEILKNKGIEVTLIKLNKIFPIEEEIINVLKRYDEIFFFEEGIKNGGIGEHLILKLLENDFKGKFNLSAIDGIFVPQSTREEAWKYLKLDCENMVKKIMNNIKKI